MFPLVINLILERKWNLSFFLKKGGERGEANQGRRGVKGKEEGGRRQRGGEGKEGWGVKNLGAE